MEAASRWGWSELGRVRTHTQGSISPVQATCPCSSRKRRASHGVCCETASQGLVEGETTAFEMKLSLRNPNLNPQTLRTWERAEEATKSSVRAL